MPSKLFVRSDLNQTLNRWLLFLIPLTFMIITPWPLSEVALWAGYGKHLITDISFLYRDTASILPTDNNITCSWALSIVYYGLYKLGGFFALAHFHHLVLLLVLAQLYKTTIFRNPWPWTPQERIPIYLVWLGAGAYFSLRPALIAFIPFLWAYQLIDKRTRDQQNLTQKDWVQLTLLQILWVNLHGSFVLLLMMVAWFSLFQPLRWRNNLIGLVVVSLATVINPFGLQIYPYVIRTRVYSQQLGISEWASAFSLNYPFQLILYWLLFIGFSSLILWNLRHKSRLPLSSPFVPLLLLPLGGLRLSVFAFLALPLFLHYWMGLYSTDRKKIARIPRGTTVAFAFITVLMIAFSPYLKPSLQKYTPSSIQASFDNSSIIEISKKIESWPDKSCPILNDFNVGHVLLLSSENPYLLDGRITPFTAKSLEAYRSLMQEKDIDLWVGWERPCLAILSVSQSQDLIAKMKSNYGFQSLMTEKDYVLLVKTK